MSGQGYKERGEITACVAPVNASGIAWIFLTGATHATLLTRAMMEMGEMKSPMGAVKSPGNDLQTPMGVPKLPIHIPKVLMCDSKWRIVAPKSLMNDSDVGMRQP